MLQLWYLTVEYATYIAIGLNSLSATITEEILLAILNDVIWSKNIMKHWKQQKLGRKHI